MGAKFDIKDLTFQVSKDMFVVDLEACGQNTHQIGKLPLDPDGLERLKVELRNALTELEGLKLGKKSSSRGARPKAKK